MTLTLLGPEPDFPPVEDALSEPNGLLAVGGDLSLARLEAAYRHGIFPWYSAGQPLLWWSPDPRMVLPPEDFHPSHSLRKKLRRIAAGRDDLEVWVDRDVAGVLRECAAPRSGQIGTWITREMQAAYLAWHRAGVVHSVETWCHGRLVGGLYGISLGGMFFGESMFARHNDASKVALAHLIAYLRHQGTVLIDCQQETAHMASLGAHPIPRAEFCQQLRPALARPGPAWRTGRLHPDGHWWPADGRDTSAGIMAHHDAAH